MSQLPFLLRRSGAAIASWAACATLCMAEALVPAPLQVCATLKKNSERLACYDRVIANLSDGRRPDAAGDTSPQSVFGITAKTPSGAREDVKTLSALIVGLRLDAYGAATFDLDNGQTWRQLAAGAPLLLNPGDRVSIARGALGSFILNTSTGRSTKVRRVR